MCLCIIEKIKEMIYNSYMAVLPIPKGELYGKKCVKK